jgi:hypothetical protein
MSEKTYGKNEQRDFIVAWLSKEKGIDSLQANEVAEYVLEAQRAFRQEKYERWVNTTVEVHIEDMRIECLIKDIRVLPTGTVQYQIKPLAGKGHKWVDSNSVNARS